MSKMTHVKSIDAFSELSDKTLERLTEIAIPQGYKKGETLFWEKDQVDAVYAVVTGKVAILRYSGNGQKRIFSYWIMVL